MKVLNDPIVGRIAYERFFWEREESVHLFGRRYEVRVRFRGEEDAPLEEAQRRSYAAFDARRDVLLAEAERAIFKFYEEILPEYRDMLGDDADRSAPIVSTAAELAAIITPTHLVVPRTSTNEERVIGLVCDCTWEPGLGLGVKFVNEVVVEIGTQDVVL